MKMKNSFLFFFCVLYLYQKGSGDMSDNENEKKEEKKNEVQKEIENGMKGIKDAFNKVGDKAKELQEKDEEGTTKKKKDALITCRVLFISILDKIILIMLGIFFVVSTYSVFHGDMSSLSYGFWYRVLRELYVVIATVISYFIYNWIYRCIAKTMMCLTENQIYMEKYIPLHRWEVSIPLNKVTSVQSYKFLWIIRCVVIWQYTYLPKIFWTWNAQQFKDKAEELLTKADYKVKNEYESKNIINKGQFKYVIYGAIVLVAIIFFLGVVRFFSYMFSDERNLQGTYSNDTGSFTLEKDGTCSIQLKNVTSIRCTWEYDSTNKQIVFKYAYKGYGSSEYENSLTTYYDKKVITYNNNEFKK